MSAAVSTEQSCRIRQASTRHAVCLSSHKEATLAVGEQLRGIVFSVQQYAIVDIRLRCCLAAFLDSERGICSMSGHRFCLYNSTICWQAKSQVFILLILLSFDCRVQVSFISEACTLLLLHVCTSVLFQVIFASKTILLIKQELFISSIIVPFCCVTHHSTVITVTHLSSHKMADWLVEIVVVEVISEFLLLSLLLTCYSNSYV